MADSKDNAPAKRISSEVGSSALDDTASQPKPALESSVVPCNNHGPGRSNLKILSLDGGGVRGLSMLIMLETIFNRLNSRRQHAIPSLPPIEPYEYFDLIGGTSTGGIIALMLGRLRMTIKQCKDEYLTLGKEVFGNRNKIWHQNKFDATRLEAVLKRVISRQLTTHEGIPGREDAPLMDPRKEACCKTIVYTVSYDNASPVKAVALRTYPISDDTRRNFSIWQAARATSAAPTYFEPLILPADGDSKWVDGGLNVNNPAWLMFSETKQIWGDENERLALDRIGLFLSLGTGVRGGASLQGGFRTELTNRVGVPEKLIKAIAQTTFDTERPHQLLLSIFNERLGEPNIYHRFNVDRGLREIELFEYKKINQIVQYTEDYLRDLETVQKLNYCVKQALEVTIDPSFIHPPKISEYHLSDLIGLLKTKATLLKESQEYFDHLTVEGLEIYDAIYGAIYRSLPQGSGGHISYAEFDLAMSNFEISSEKLSEIWKRMGGGFSSLMPRNLMLCILYMTHVECFDRRFKDQRPPMSEERTGENKTLTEDRLIIAKSFGNWVPCRFHLAHAWCGREWNYANHQWGMCRGLDTDVECPLWQWHQGRIEWWNNGARKNEDYVVTMPSEDHVKAKSFRDQCRKRWLDHSETIKHAGSES